MTRWSTVTREAEQSAGRYQLHIEERVRQTERLVLILLDRVAEDRHLAEEVHDQLTVLLAKAREAVVNATHCLQGAEAIALRARTTLALWEDQLAQALAWLARAEARVLRAEAELAAAESELRSAEHELWAAESALNNCRSYRDSKGNRRDCSGPATQVHMARARVVNAQHRVRAAQLELADARAERARALNRVNCCQEAVSLSREALSEAIEAIEEANTALNIGERAVEVALSAKQHSDRALLLLEQEEDSANQMAQRSRHAINTSGEARVHYTAASLTEESAQRYYSLVRIELAYRIAVLYELDAPTL